MARVLLFGWFAEKAGWDERQIAASTLAELSGLVAACHPDIAQSLASGRGLAAVNQSLVDKGGDLQLSDADEVAFFPPVSGG